MIYKKGVHRPMTAGIQEVVRSGIDGYFGDKTVEKVKEYQYDNGFEETGEVNQELLNHMFDNDFQLVYCVAELIAFFEVGATRNAWTATSVVPGDGAGKNWGVVQHNRFGSLQLLKRQYMPAGADFEEWFYTTDCAKAQMKYFLEQIWARSTAFAYKVGDISPKAVALFSDAIVQGGHTLPSKAPKTWKDWQLDHNYLEFVKACYEQNPAKKAFVKAIMAHDDVARAFAELHPRSGNLRWLDDQLSRRRTVAIGEGWVHGSKYVLSDYGIR
jgi:hypothetical protein